MHIYLGVSLKLINSNAPMQNICIFILNYIGLRKTYIQINMHRVVVLNAMNAPVHVHIDGCSAYSFLPFEKQVPSHYVSEN